MRKSVHIGLLAATIVSSASLFPILTQEAAQAGGGGPSGRPSGVSERSHGNNVRSIRSQERAVPDFLSRVNPNKDKGEGYMLNCMECSWVTYKFLEGHDPGPAPAYQGMIKHRPIHENFARLKAEIEKATGRKFKPHGSYKSISAKLRDSGPGAHGIVIGRWWDLDTAKENEHAFNVVNEDGEITYLDGQFNRVTSPGFLSLSQVYREWELLLAPTRLGQARGARDTPASPVRDTPSPESDSDDLNIRPEDLI